MIPFFLMTGPTKTATEYFKSLNYSLPPGESIADWLIDISSGRLEADSKIADIAPKSELLKAFAKVSPTAYRNLSSSFDLDIVDENGDDKDIDDGKREATTPHDENGDDKDTDDDKGEATTLHAKQMMRGDMDSLEREKSLRIDELKSKDDEENSSFEDVQETKLVPGESQRIRVNDDHVCGSRGVTGGKVVQAFEEAKIRRAWLYEEWNKYFTTMIAAEKALYAVPEEYDLPKDVIKPSFFTQLNHQVKRGFIVARRNLFSKVIDAAIIVAAVIIITATDGVAEISLDHDPDIPFDIMTRPDIEEDGKILNTELFGYALTRQIT